MEMATDTLWSYNWNWSGGSCSHRPVKAAVEWETASEIMDKIHQEEYCTGGTVLKTEYTGFIKLFLCPWIILKARFDERRKLRSSVSGQVVYYSC